MSLTVYDVSVPVFSCALANLAAWLDKALAEGMKEAILMEARLAPDMLPFPAQVQRASYNAHDAVARLAGVAPPAMSDIGTGVAELRERCRRTIAFLDSIEPAALDGAAEREIVLKMPNGTGYRFTGRAFLTGFALPNFFFHVTEAYAILRAQGVPLGKRDVLQHLGPPNVGGAS